MYASIIAAAAIAFAPLVQAAETLKSAYTPPPSAVTSGSVLQIILSLALVLATVVVVGWLLKRMNLPQQGSGNALRVVSGVAVGQRERVVLVEVNDTWLVVGVAPGQVTALHHMPKGSIPISNSNVDTVKDSKFQQWLKQVMEKRNAN